ncbi:HNH endonuclease signature motif containing protein [Nostoc sp. LPT]|uniref:HNH endonuclease n=1 Tax=Nostoc sp. LPT TaxID=2815387 RepID=UPI001D6A055B|nr:HNH endonuclease signature motif containing protein [Nostoc sp. LPT]MBN4003758.1 HNH endonuclease [Nostoc sp. LPT]
MSVYIPVELKKEIRNHFADCCAYCRTAEALTLTTFEFEHIIPLSAGGETIFENLCLACPSCNRYKATRKTAIDPNTQDEVKLFNPQQQLWTYHFAWSEDDTEILGITSVGRSTILALKMNRLQLISVQKMWVKMGEHPPKI